MSKRDLTREYLEEALRLAKRDLPGWAFAMLRNEARARVGGKARKKPKELEPEEPVEKQATLVPATGPKGAMIAFVGASPAPVDVARCEPFTGPVGETLRDSYIRPLGLSSSDVVKATLVPVLLTDESGVTRQPIVKELDEWSEQFAEELDRLDPKIVVALGKIAKQALGDRADFVLPHPSAIRRFGNKGEIDRKLRRIKKAIDVASATIQIWDEVAIAKADNEKQIVYGVVLSSYGKDGSSEDAHGDWTPPSEIERTAHEWLQKSRQIGIGHPGMAGFKSEVDSEPVESHIEKYPSTEDYEKAMAGEPHRVTRRKFGDDVVHSGDWILGTKLGDASWKAFKSGEYNAYSVEGVGMKSPASSSIMPEITFIDVE